MPPEPRSSRVDTLLRQAGGALDADDAVLLLAHVLDRPRSWLYAHGDAMLAPAEVMRFSALARQRADGLPVAYLTGRRGFWTLDLAVSPATLIPRADTERLVELALARLSSPGAHRIVDLGTGSGAIALALASERPHARIIATDASGEALDVARANATRLGLGNVEFRLGDWFEAVPGELFDMVASNPPYIADRDPHLAAGDLRFEPASALASGSDGLDAIRSIARGAPAYLAHGGWLLLEHGSDQGEAVAGILAAVGLVDVATEQDIEGRDRVTLGRLP